MMRISWISHKNSKQFSHHLSHLSNIRLTLWNNFQPRRIQQSLLNIPLWSRITGEIHHWKVGSILKLVACGILNMRSYHQDYMNYLSRQNSKETMLYTSRTSTTTSRCVSLRWLDSKNNFFLVTSTSTDTLILNNTSYQIVITLPSIGMTVYKLPLGTHW